MTVGLMDARRIARLRAAELTYAEVGMTSHDVFPAEYRSFRRSVVLRAGVDFKMARGELLTWGVHRRAGLQIAASGDVAQGVVVDLRLGVGPISVRAPCRVVYVLDEPRRCGFAYGTLPGHPESGEESFVLDCLVDRTIRFTVAGFSRPATALSRLAGPIGSRVQDFMTSRYLRAFV
jgi:uncharacterized protein (UPF0548 family)